MKKINPESFLEVQKLSALENQTLRGGVSQVQNSPGKRKKRKEDDEIHVPL